MARGLRGVRAFMPGMYRRHLPSPACGGCHSGKALLEGEAEELFVADSDCACLSANLFIPAELLSMEARLGYADTRLAREMTRIFDTGNIVDCELALLLW